MGPRTAHQWRDAVKELRIARIQVDEKLFLDEVAKELAELPDVEDWMVPGLLNAAVEEWESRIHHFRIDCAFIEAENARREEARRAADRRDGNEDPTSF